MRGRKPSDIVSGDVTRVPSPPRWLSPDAKAEWRRIMPGLVERRILTDADFGMVENYCVAIGRVREIERQIQASAGLVDLALYRAQDKAMMTARQIATEIGATPVARSRAAVREEADEGADDLGLE